MSATTVAASDAGTYVHWGVVQISLTNLIIIGLMLLVFILAILVPFPGSGRAHESEKRP